MKKYVLLKDLNDKKAGSMIELDENSFDPVYYCIKGIIQPDPVNDTDKREIKAKKPQKQQKKDKK